MSVMFTSRDVPKSVRFYRDKLGFELKECWPDAGNLQWANMTLGGQSVMLGAAMDPETVGQQCQGDTQKEAYWRQAATEFRQHKPGVGVLVYVMVDDVDAYHAEIVTRGAYVPHEPKTQFYGIREFWLEDPDGYRLVVFSPVSMASCQSCGMPLKDADPGQMFCGHCADVSGQLRPYDAVLEGTTTGYFMAMRKMPRVQAEKAAREQLAKMLAWSHRGS
jgi:uncharacterized glyoxalase superfamily protein PhnB